MSNSAATQVPQADDAGLTAIFPLVNTTKIKGKDFEVLPVTLGQIPSVLLAVQPLRHLLTAGVPLDFANIFYTALPDCYAMMSAMSGQSLDWIKSLNPEDGLRLFTKQLEVNLDFLLHRVLPLMPALVGIVKALRAGAEKAISESRGQTESKT